MLAAREREAGEEGVNESHRQVKIGTEGYAGRMAFVRLNSLIGDFHEKKLANAPCLLVIPFY
jgi:hypothetical protein